MEAKDPKKNSEQGEFRAQLSAADCLQMRVDNIQQAERSDYPQKPTQEDFKEYGILDNGVFTSYWKDEETFEDFLKREAGLSRAPAEIIQSVVENFFLKRNIPISEEDKEKLSQLGDLFSAEEIDQFQAYSLMVEDEMAYSLALMLEAYGTLLPGSVFKVDPLVDRLREEADEEMREFDSQVREMADAVNGFPERSSLDTTEETVLYFKKTEILPQEPKIEYISSLGRYVYAATTKGETTPYSDSSPVISITDRADLVVLDELKSQQLTSSLLDKKSLLRYLLGSDIVKEYFKIMKNFSYLFTIVRARKNIDNSPDRKWPFKVPARKPESVTSPVEMSNKLL